MTSKISAIRWDIRKFGLRGAAARLARSITYHAWLRLSPSGRQEREFDARNGVETDGNVSRRELGLNQDSEGYFPSRPHFVESLIRKLPIERGEFTFVDIGCGKGRPLIVAHSLGFKLLIGIEMSPALADIAMENTHSFGARIATRDVTEFLFPSGKLVVYMYNPFGNPTMGKFVRNLDRLVRYTSTKVYVIYVNPFCEGPLASSRQFKKLCGVENEYAIYESQRGSDERTYYRKIRKLTFTG